MSDIEKALNQASILLCEAINIEARYDDSGAMQLTHAMEVCQAVLAAHKKVCDAIIKVHRVNDAHRTSRDWASVE